MSEQIIVKLSVESMRHEILHAFTGHQVDIQNLVQDALNGAVKSFDFGTEVRNEAVKLLREEVKKQIQYAIWRVLWDEKSKEAIEEGVRKALTIAGDSRAPNS